MYQLSALLLLCTTSLTGFVSLAQETHLLHWQPSRLESNQQVLKASFTVSAYQSEKLSKVFAEPLHITARPGQILTVCGHGVTSYNEADGTEPNLFIQGGLTKVSLTDWQTTLDIKQPFSCPAYEASHQPYHFRNVICSDQSFMVALGQHLEKRQKLSGFNSNKGTIPITGLPSALPNPVSLLSGTGDGSDSGGDNFFKRPPHLTMMGKGDFSLTFLPLIRLPAQWQKHPSGWQWLHWVMGEPDAQAGVTVIIKFNQLAPVALNLTPWEYRELAENMLGTHQLLQWLAYKLSGRESFIQALLNITALMSEQEALDETLSAKLEEQLMAVLELPDMEFSLEFEQHELHQTLFKPFLLTSPDQNIVQLPTGKVSGQQSGLSSGRNTESGATSSHQGGNHKSGLPPENRQQTGDNNRRPEQPSAPDKELASGQFAVDYFEFYINGHIFKIKKNQLNPERRGQEDANTIMTEHSGLLLPLDQIEETAGVPAIRQLANIDSKALKYFVTYGTESTRWALLDLYPASIISLQENYLAVNPDAVIPETALECPICQDALLARENLIQSECRDIFHPACLVHFLRTLSRDNGEEPRCPVCRNNLPELMSVIGTDELQQNQLRAAAARGDSTTAKCLLEAGVNADSINREGNTALHLATESGHYHVAEQLIRYGAHPNTTNKAGITPIELAVAKGHTNIAEMLSEAKKTPGIFFAVGHGRVDLLEVWLDDGEPVDITRQPDGLSLLHLAVKNNHPEIVSKLLVYARSLGIDITSQTDIHGRTALHYACDYGFSNIADILIENGGNTHKRDLFGKTPLMLATERGYSDIVRMLEQRLPNTEPENLSEREPDSLLIQSPPAHNPVPTPEQLPVAKTTQPPPDGEGPDYYTLKIAQTIFRIACQNLGEKLCDTLVFWLNAQCQDCGDTIWLSLSRHANGHIIACNQCQQFIPPEGTLAERQTALRTHHSACTAKSVGSAAPYNPAVTARDYSILSLFFRFATPESIYFLLADNDSAVITTALKKRGYLGQQPLHVLFAHGTTEAIRDFLSHQQSLLHSNPDLLRMQQRDGWSPLHMLFYKGSSENIRLFIDLYSDLLMSYPLMLQYCTTDGWTALHTLLRYQPAEIIQYFLEHNKLLLEQHPVVFEKSTSQDWNALHILFFYGKPATAIAFIESFSDFLNHQPQLLDKYNKNRDTPVNILLSKGTVKTTDLFFQKCEQWLAKNPDRLVQPNRQGQTLLHSFCLKATPDLIRQLLDKSAALVTLDHLTRKTDRVWTVLDCLFQRATPQVLIPWLREHLLRGVQPLAEPLFTELLEHTQSWQDFVGHIVSSPALKANPLLDKIAAAGRILNPLPGGVLLEGTARSCPITGEAIQIPVITNPCGHEFEQEALQQWMERSAAKVSEGKFRCPRCSRAFSSYIRSYPDD